MMDTKADEKNTVTMKTTTTTMEQQMSSSSSSSTLVKSTDGEEPQAITDTTTATMAKRTTTTTTGGATTDNDTTEAVTSADDTLAIEDAKPAANTQKKTATKKAAAKTKKPAVEEVEEAEEAEKPAEKPKAPKAPRAKSTAPKGTMTIKEPKDDKPAMNKDEEKKAKLRKVDWRDLIPIGFELKELSAMRKEEFTFDKLNKELVSGFLSNRDHPLYIFMGAQPIVEKKVAMNIPYIVVFDCKTPPPQKICKASIQGATEEVFDISKDNRFKVSWLPYVRSKLYNMDWSKVAKPIFTLQCNSRGRTSNAIPEEKLIELQYLLPYIRLPQIVENLKFIDVTAVTFDFEAKLTPEQLEKEKKQAAADDKKREEEFTSKGKTVRLSKAEKEMRKQRDECLARGVKKLFIAYDKAVDTLSSFLEEKKEDEGLSDEGVADLKAKLKEVFASERARRQKAFQDIQDEVAAMSEEDKQNYRNCRIYKFYPTHPTIDVAKYSSKVVNRYFGNAHEVYPEEVVVDLSTKKLASKEELAAAKEDYERDKALYEEKRQQHEAEMKAQTEGKTSKRKAEKSEDEVEEEEDAEMAEEEEAEEEADEEKQPKKKSKTTAAATKKTTKSSKK